MHKLIAWFFLQDASNPVTKIEFGKNKSGILAENWLSDKNTTNSGQDAKLHLDGE